MWVEAIEHEGLQIPWHRASPSQRSTFDIQDNVSSRPVKACYPPTESSFPTPASRKTADRASRARAPTKPDGVGTLEARDRRVVPSDHDGGVPSIGMAGASPATTVPRER